MALALVVPAGYLVRFHLPLPDAIRDAAGGAAYVVSAALALLLVAPRLTGAKAALIGFALTCAVEASQLVSTAWLDAVRATRLGRLVLGSTFAWSDLPPYALGGLLAWAIAGCLLSRAADR